MEKFPFVNCQTIYLQFKKKKNVLNASSPPECPFMTDIKRCLLVSTSCHHRVYKEARPVLNTRWVPPSFRPVRPVFHCHNITALITHSLDHLVWSDEQEAGSEQEGSGFESTSRLSLWVGSLYVLHIPAKVPARYPSCLPQSRHVC